MKHLQPDSLSATLDALAEALFFGTKMPAAQRNAAAKWIAGRQGLPGAYAGMFAPTEHDKLGIQLFTGEPVRSNASIAHLLGEESCRILRALSVDDPKVQMALQRAVQGMSARLEAAEQQGYSTGIYCCGTCSAGYWRNLAINLFPRAEERLRRGLADLKRLRKGDGQWQRFPFYYTCLALTEIGPGFASAEMQYAAPRWKKLLPRLSRAEDIFSRRRAEIGRRLFELCG